VHRGGGRTGSTNSYTVVTGHRVIHSPGQNVTPDRLSGVDTGDRPPRTQPCQGTPDIAVSPDPPENRQGTAAAPAREVPAARPGVGCGGAEVGEFFEQFAARNQRWLLTAGQRKRLAPSITAALAAGWTPDGLASFAGANSAGIRNPVAMAWPASPEPTALGSGRIGSARSRAGERARRSGIRRIPQSAADVWLEAVRKLREQAAAPEVRGQSASPRHVIDGRVPAQ